MKLELLFNQLAEVFDGPEAIESIARNALLTVAPKANFGGNGIALQQAFLDVMLEPKTHPVCKAIAELSLPWAPPKTSGSTQYIKDSQCKAHVEVLGPGGLIKSDEVRIGLYGMLPNSAYGIRTHPAEEIYVMLAGVAEWKRGTDTYLAAGTGERSFHPSMMEHATRTGDKAFMSVYVWHGDISTEDYVYQGSG